MSRCRSDLAVEHGVGVRRGVLGLHGDEDTGNPGGFVLPAVAVVEAGVHGEAEVRGCVDDDDVEVLFERCKGPLEAGFTGAADRAVAGVEEEGVEAGGQERQAAVEVLWRDGDDLVEEGPGDAVAFDHVRHQALFSWWDLLAAELGGQVALGVVVDQRVRRPGSAGRLDAPVVAGRSSAMA
jgi:hypothetical protein